MHLLFDIEANGLLDTVDTIWCAVVKDLSTGKLWTFEPHQIDSFIELLKKATRLYGHNIIGYDLPALKIVTGFVPESHVEIIDTLKWAQCAYSDIERNDYNDPNVQALTRAGMIGRHSLQAWGIRLGNLKGDYGKSEEAWDKYTFDMLLYCKQDLSVNEDLIEYLRKSKVPVECLRMEMEFAAISEEMSQHGFRFDTEKALALCAEIEQKQKEINERLQAAFEPEIETHKKPRFYRVQWPDGTIQKFPSKGAADAERKARGIKPKDVSIKKGPPNKTLILFNPNSRPQVRQKLFEKYGWLSPELTDKGQELQAASQQTHAELAIDYGVVNEDTLGALSAPEAKDLIAYMMCSKRLGQIRDGDNGWLRLVTEEGRIHHRMNTIGCATFRCSHASPNMSQVPSVLVGSDKKPKMGFDGGWGYECRSLFLADGMYTLVGTDLSGIESRMLAHFLKPYDGGAYIEHVLHGDIHMLNVEAIKSITGYTVSRGDSKPLFYSWTYGAGTPKMGLTLADACEEARDEYVRLYNANLNRTLKVRDFSTRSDKQIWGGDFPNEASKQAYGVLGQRVKDAFENGLSGFGDLLKQIKFAAKRGFIKALDGRHIPVRSSHSALNTLLQGNSAIVFKRWVVSKFKACRQAGIDCNLHGLFHDESETSVRTPQVNDYCRIVLEQAKKAGRFYKMSIPLAAESKIGSSWAECH